MTIEQDHHRATGWRAVALEMMEGTREAIIRLPVTALFLLLMTLNASLLIADRGLFSIGGEKDFVLPFLAAALASLAVGLLCESRNAGPWLRHGCGIVAGTMAFCLIWLHDATYSLRWTLVVALAGLVVVSPYTARGTGAALWLFAVRLAFAIILAALALFLFAGGISAIFASLTYLFGIEVPNNLYLHVWAVTGLLAAPLFGLGQIPREFAAEPDATAAGFMERGMRALGDFVAAPLLIVYALILHLYGLKILVTGEVPQGQIGWLVLAFGFCVFGSLIVIHPFLSAARAPTRLLLRLWPFMLPVPLLLLFYALALRVGQYGVTPERFLLGLFGIVAAILLTLQILPRTRGDIRYMTALPVIALALASFGPQGAVATALRSQSVRFLTIVNNPPVEGERHDEALSALRYLSSENAARRVAPDGFDDRNAGGSEYRAVALAWGLDPDRPRFDNGEYFTLNYPQSGALEVGDFDLMVPNISVYGGNAQPGALKLPGGAALGIRLDENAVVIAKGGSETRFVFSADEIRGLVDKGQTETPTIVLESDGRKILLVPTFISGRVRSDPQLTGLSGTLLLRARDWR
ncbi:uncharacterized protein DUF4153 [Mesorhizobium sp. J18]|uniref:DUF4153 domain-containing protein n=1 Tax=Mesorhizobium sp. J18 TaxID=935263 RepID=UPI001199CBC9|nr:DUF4153 domain-containing protein [Mesorhizobium sp. J18]TWG95558.1 uncharacterized protein DUF4153 [Mesorhizobium sp. J18]